MGDSTVEKVTEKPVFDETATPSQNPDVDVESLSETPSSDEFFLYSRIDGQTTVKELCTRSGLGRDATIEALERLADVGLVEVPGYGPEPSESDESSSTPVDQTGSGDEGGEKDEAAETSSGDGLDLSYLPTPPEAFDFPQDLLDLDVPLDERKRREVICIHDHLDDLDHFEFFGVGRDADRGEIKRAYFKLSKRFHPDKHFRKELGPYNDMLERIFQQITKAHRILSDPKRRQTYEASLEDSGSAESGGSEQGAGATPMSHNEVDSATEGASDSGTKKRNAAFAQLVRRAKSSARSGDYEETTEHFRKALSLKRDADVALQAAQLLKQTRQHREEALLFARAAIRIDDDHVEARMLLGDVLEEMGRTDEAMAVYREVRQLDKDHRGASRRLDTLTDTSH